ncbi:NADH-quinone oxidoreductase subunit NuoE family protein [Williamwhitmania taraxaci]|uniref:NADH-quinone oxidoreductase subunit E n=1 Tax=Williamwhitmania taraxaci TaxID=1640674 RepID=A0A1G6NRI8_9BACT|nr:NAD(P)H-dependent oxidoreductase subunit E [Williamwhitmania taraxaci]SDC70600.1 NADH-quinone oxidoreductase subunit E [Williamwhitmania taraxaci]
MTNSNVDAVLEKYLHHGRESLIPILQEIQDDLGYIPESALERVGKILNIPTAKIYGLATFYNQFRFLAKGKYHITLCKGSACHMFGATTLLTQLEKELKIKQGQTTRNGLFSIEVVPCMAACSQAPLISVNGQFYTKLTHDRLKETIESFRNTQ